MTVGVELFASLADYLPRTETRGRADLEVPAGSTVHDVVRLLGIPDEQPRIVLVNGLDAADDRTLAPGDTVAIFPPLAGGR